ncbi:hypothetical protein HanRHA438_Chr08g0340971 [Helianthus annuus]|nr:hypothetical protein HanIR_Chr15g0743581 [Helianthus annuus]KAJ0483183.1 hypothetical protein HanIR_Chr13g0662111 [Helianthus annuus]KAJ0552827.1 hypothetical protein HanHA89_Chr08g0289491 [Helianthus annuus]KAJ0570460.1 hypothetical protein HanHA300_Chr05g0178241 [Helianthus annuus]KAJ0692552.1 hypothetical protein HanPI659440_Chr15g0587321 [Helianthus annuus]
MVGTLKRNSAAFQQTGGRRRRAPGRRRRPLSPDALSVCRRAKVAEATFQDPSPTGVRPSPTACGVTIC